MRFAKNAFCISSLETRTVRRLPICLTEDWHLLNTKIQDIWLPRSFEQQDIITSNDIEYQYHTKMNQYEQTQPRSDSNIKLKSQEIVCYPPTSGESEAHHHLQHVSVIKTERSHHGAWIVVGSAAQLTKAFIRKRPA